ncbi:MAG: ABC transporter substrate-binding protein [Gammaproteobacteria bacterium]|nr:ABC transporter substrate-binding protein [Gammaproteobacteria bacterium]
MNERTQWIRRPAAILAVSLALTAGVHSGVWAKEYILGYQCDRSGPTQVVGAFICDGTHDYFRLANKQGMFGEHTVRVFEIDHGYNVPRGVEAYERTKQEGHISYALYGTPHTYALTPKLTADKVPGTSPGFGSAGAANGKSYPYIFPIAATYWSQAGAAVKFVMDQWQAEGQSGTPKVAYIYYDNPAGREPLPVLRDLQKRIGFAMRKFAVPPPGVEMRPQVLDIVRKYRADWVIAHLFGRAPGVSMKEFSRLRFPMNRIVGFVWAGAESDVAIAGWDTAEGYNALQFAGVGHEHAIINEIKEMYKAEGKPEPEQMKVSVYYNRGVFMGAVHAKAIANAIEAKGGGEITGDDVRKGFEQIRDFSLDGFLPPLNITEEDHEGGGWVQVWQVKGGKFVKKTDWIRGYRDVVLEHVSNAEPPKTR